MANEVLTRTPTSTGNRKKFTWAGWIKRNDINASGGNSYQGIFAVGTSDGAEDTFMFSSDQIRLRCESGSDVTTSEKYRDSGNWMHVIMVVDTTLYDPDHRCIFYLNGVKSNVMSQENDITQNANLRINSAAKHYIGEFPRINNHLDGQIYDVFLVDGQALTPDVFGFYKDGEGYQSSGSSHATDFRPGQWMPHSPSKIKKDINRRGGFGVNGFYLPMNDSSNPGADFHMTPNSIIKLKGEDLPQPRNGAPTTSDSYVSQLRQETGTLGFDGVVKFDGVGDYLTFDGSSIDFGTGDFTVEAFVYHTGGNDDTIISDQTGFTFTYGNNGKLRFYHANGSNVVDATVNFISYRWVHVAVVRSSNTLTFYQDGNAVGSHAYNNDIGTNSTTTYIGKYFGGTVQDFDGFVSNLRVIQGTALYTANFTAPSAPLTNVTNTKLLCCNSSTSATAATVTPGTITANGNAFATRNELTGSILLAVPGITGGQGSGYGDYSADIKGSGTNKTITANNNATVSATASYYGSAMAFDGTTDSFQYSVPNNDALFLQNTNFTIECWVYPNTSFTDDRYLIFLGNGSSSNNNSCYYLRIYDTYYQGIMVNSNNQYATTSSNTYKSEQWTHVAYVRDGNEQRLYINGVCETVTTHSILPNVNNSSTFFIGSSHGLNNSINAQIQDVRIYDGVAKYKGGFDVPKPYSPEGIEEFRTTTDTCKNNFASLNPLSYQTSGTYGTSYPVLTDGNLKFTHGQTGQWERSNCTMGGSEGKWYFEFKIVSGAGLSGNNENWAVGVRESDSSKFYDCSDGFENQADHVYWIDAGTAKIVSNQSRGSGSTSGISGVANGDIINIAFEKTATALKVWFGKNGTYFNSGNPATGANPAVNHATTTEYIIPAASFYQYSGQVEPVGTFNFGQNPTFSGAVAAGTNADDSGKGLFKYAVPSGYSALCEDNLPTPAIADPGKHFKCVLYEGNGGLQSVNGVGFQPDFVWIKSRTSSHGSGVFDVIRGIERLDTSSTQEGRTNEGNIVISSDGFDITSSHPTTNNSGSDIVSWCWKAGGAAVSNTDGSITSQVSANPTAGFSIVKGTMTSGTDTLGHGLGKAPKMIITKQTNGTTGWYTYHKDIGSGNTLRLDTTAASTSFAHWVTDPTTSVFSMGSGFGSGEIYVAYCFAEIEGYSKIGSFEGNGSTDGTFVYLGFKPALVIAKQIDTVYTVGGSAATSWGMWDSSRMPNNPAGNPLWANLSSTETTRGNGSSANTGGSDGNGLGGFLMCDLLSNGFKARSAGSEFNSAGTHIYMAWAESPFKTANAK